MSDRLVAPKPDPVEPVEEWSALGLRKPLPDRRDGYGGELRIAHSICAFEAELAREQVPVLDRD